MPANLNALIRYKTINSCLYGGRRKWSIQELSGSCSEALAESRGRYDPVSERTIRDDIRVMRSDILGFNAPIEQVKGLYFYSDPKFSIMSVSITDSGLAEKIFDFLMKLRPELSHPELEIILEKLSELTGRRTDESDLISNYDMTLMREEIEPPAASGKCGSGPKPKDEPLAAPLSEKMQAFRPDVSGFSITSALSWEEIYNGLIQGNNLKD
jgi:hypothetical protein